MQRVGRLQGGRPAHALAVLLLAAALLPGCLNDPLHPAGPLTLLEAHALGQAAARRIDPGASLIGFIGHEGKAPGFLDERLAPHVAATDNPTDTQRADGRTAVWVLLYGTEAGSVIRAETQGGTLADIGPVGTARDPDVQALWWLNLGGRLLVDSPRAVASARDAVPQIAAHVDAHPDQGVVYASTLAELDSPGGPVLDLAYELFFDHDGDTRPFAHFARVSHFSGQVLAHGDAAAHASATRQTLLDETFHLNPLVPRVETDAMVPRPVKAPLLTLDADGHGTFTLEIRDAQGKTLTRIDEPLLLAAQTYERELPPLGPGNHTLTAEATGDITFHLMVEGTIRP